MGGILVLSYYNQLLGTGMERGEAVLHAARTQFRPVMMTCVAACVGLLPAAVATGIGSQVQKPLALVVVGGILVAPVLILIVLPVMIEMFSNRRPRELNDGVDWLGDKPPPGPAAPLPLGPLPEGGA